MSAEFLVTIYFRLTLRIGIGEYELQRHSLRVGERPYVSGGLAVSDVVKTACPQCPPCHC
jgi:hypothetical protein